MPIGAIAAIAGPLIGAAGGLIGGGQQAGATTDAARIQANAANRAADLQFQEFGQITNNMQPFLRGGAQAYDTLLGGYYGIGPGNSMGGGFDPNAEFLQPISARVGAPPSPNDPSLRSDFTASPGYGYALSQMGDAVQNSAAGRTGAVSGNMLRALQTNANGLANQDWWNYYNALLQSYGQRYSDIAGQRNTITSVLGGMAAGGQNAAANLGGFGQAAATSAGNAIQSGANAQAAGRIGTANAFANMFNNPQLQNGATNGINYLLGVNGGGYNTPGMGYQDPGGYYGYADGAGTGGF